MTYIDFEEFKKLSGKTDDFKSSFDKYLLKASAILDNETNYFYRFHNIKDDPIDFRVNQFKLALCAQIIYFDEVGGDTYHSINKTPQSFSAGRTSISNKSSENGGDTSLLSEDVYVYLEGTGLLYRGVPSC
ncbi:hypothetical protein EM4838_03135 [Enterococcus mundtii]|uniref:Phage gp6-like head-tail connector protein n=1 Tax=Enterococcus mundtii TaxID=53346 RepID=A0ABQ0VGF5_ENTMU|nr:hypothetical protein [Enterococcus mundtii]AUB52031.1 hypothetical protein EM4838_03135 [Enterococcus mundtii]OJG57077.1 hypothetical protein RV08_GL002232 [Enterococcus mundtii]GEL81730.1 hypothetical protein EMU01_28740 [Enterococcus mundtii]GEN20571.1 hypothetical protein LAC02_38520 [Ligilactobacillus acidipiscis]